MNIQKTTILACWILIFSSCGNLTTNETEPKPTKGQQAMIDRKYGMFIHFGINTYLDQEWSNGTDSANKYNPPADISQKIADWARIAKEAGMRSILLTTKHHDGFCLWDSKYTEHDIAHLSIKNKIDVVKVLSDACKKQGIAFSCYYSLWDRHEPSYMDDNKYLYITYMKNQLTELMSNYGTISELWLDGVWDRELEDWHLQELYDHVKALQPDCQISTNWTLGKRPVDMKYGDTIVYYPADFRLWDPHLPMVDDPKIYTYNGNKYYLPFECTQTISILGNWFNHPADTTVRELEELEEIFYFSTINDNCLLLNIPPDIDGNMNPKAVKRISELGRKLSIENGKDFPKSLKPPTSLTTTAKARTGSVFNNDELHWGGIYAIDSDVSTAWKSAEKTGWIEIILEKESIISRISIIENEKCIKKFSLEAKNSADDEWKLIHSGTTISDEKTTSFMGYGFGEIILDSPLSVKELRLNIHESKDLPAIYSIRAK